MKGIHEVFIGRILMGFSIADTMKISSFGVANSKARKYEAIRTRGSQTNPTINMTNICLIHSMLTADTVVVNKQEQINYSHISCPVTEVTKVTGFP
jgi:hypothetical protein